MSRSVAVVDLPAGFEQRPLAYLRPRLFPILSRRGLLLACSLAFVPLVGFSFRFPLQTQVLVVAILLLTAVTYFLLLSVWLRKHCPQWLAVRLRDPLFSGQVFELELLFELSHFTKAIKAIDVPLDIAVAEVVPKWKSSELRGYRSFVSEQRAMERGELFCSEISLRLRDPLNVFAIQASLYLQQPIERRIEANPGFSATLDTPALLRANAGDQLLHHARGEGREFDSLRHYVAGDDLRKVDWKRSSKGLGLLVKSYRPESHQRIHIIMDCGRRLGTLVEGRPLIEYACDAAAHLIHSTAALEDQFAFFAFDSERRAAIACRRGAGQRAIILEALHSVRAGLLESDYQHITDWALQERRRALLLIMSSVSNPAGIDTLARALIPIRNRHFAVFVAIADRELERRAQQPASSVLDAYESAAAVAQLGRLRTSLERLRRLGLASVYTDAASLSQELRRAYIEAKQSGRL